MPDREAGVTFTSFIHGAREALDGWYGLSFEERMTLTELAYLADYRTGIYKTTRNALAKEWGIHPETVRDRLDALQGAVMVAQHFPRGHQGSVLIVPYVDIVNLRSTDRDRVLEAQAKWYAQRASAALRAGSRKAPQRGMTGVMDGVVVDLQARRRNAE